MLLSGESYSLENFPLKGHHNIENLMAVMLLLTTLPQLKNSAKAIIKASSSFVLAPHRCEHFLAEFGCFVNDSKATNPDATNRAIGSLAKQYSGKLRLILGGRDKEMDFTLMQDQVLKHCKELYLYGEARETLADIFEKKVKCQLIEGFSEATTQALQDLQKNEALLLSPACASQDQFKSYGERGDLFKDLVRKFYH